MASGRRRDPETEGWQNEPLAHEATHGHELGVRHGRAEARARAAIES
jgi:hypothetical protein